MNRMSEGTKSIAAVAMVALCFVTGCTTVPTQAYKGPELPITQVATITCERKQYTIWNKPQFEDLMTIRTLDGEELTTKMGGHPSAVCVLPGKHTVVARMSGGAGLLTLIVEKTNEKFDTPLSVNAEAGTGYKVCADIIRRQDALGIKGGWTYWLEEARTGRVVCGKHPNESELAGNEKTSMLAPKIPIYHDYSNPLR